MISQFIRCFFIPSLVPFLNLKADLERFETNFYDFSFTDDQRNYDQFCFHYLIRNRVDVCQCI